MKTKLSPFKCYIFHRRIGINLWNKVILLAVGLVLGVLLVLGEMFMLEHNLRLTREGEILDLIRNHYRLTTFGAPGYVRNDWTEGTVDIPLKEPK